MYGRSERRRGTARARQRLLHQFERSERLEHRLRRAILVLTVAVAAAILGGTPLGRYASLALVLQTKALVLRPFHPPASRRATDQLWALRRERDIVLTTTRYEETFQQSKSSLQELLRVSGMAPGEALLRWANYDRTLLFSSRIYEADDRGRSYRLRPSFRAVWLRDFTMVGSPFGMLLVPDTPAVHAAAARAGVLFVPGSEQSTNSWGLRGPEPDTSADVRGLVLGDSFMQGLFIGDDETPAACLQRALAERRRESVSLLNTGHLGYSPEQYYYTLREYGDRFRPHFVVVSVCPNDFGDGLAVLDGRGDWREAKYWLDRIQGYCRAREIACVVAPVPCDARLDGPRFEGNYPGLIANACRLDSLTYCNPFDDFVNEHLRLVAEKRRQGVVLVHSPLYNRHISDGHFSRAGAAVWGRALARRLDLLLDAPHDRTIATRRSLASVRQD